MNDDFSLEELNLFGAVGVKPPETSLRLRVSGSDPQLEFWRSQAKYSAFIGGVGSGKSLASCVKIIMQPAKSIGTVVGPSYDVLRRGMQQLFLEKFEKFIKIHNKSHNHTTLLNGTQFTWRSSENPNYLRGSNLNWFAIDEASYCSEDTWKIMVGRLRREPKGKPNCAWVTTTPAGTKHWLYDYFVRRASQEPDKFSLIHSRTNQNKYLPDGFYDDLAAQYSSAYAAQELDGRFVDFDQNRVNSDWIRLSKDFPDDLRIQMGVDLAISQKESADYTALVVVGYHEPTGLRYVLDVVRGRWTFGQIVSEIKDLAGRWSPDVVNIESVAFQSAVAQELQRTTSLYIREVRPKKDKVSRFLAAENLIEKGLLLFHQELPQSFFDEVLEFPNGKHDDQVDALVYACDLPIIRRATVLGEFGDTFDDDDDDGWRPI